MRTKEPYLVAGSDSRILGKRSDYCGELRASDIGREVTVCGWVNTRRDHGGVVFVDLRDHTGLVQVVFKPEVDGAAHAAADTLRSEFALEVRGRVEHRESGNVNPKLPTGEVEVLATTLTIHNASLPPLYDWDGDVDERLRLKYRYFELRRPAMQQSLRVRSQAAKVVRDYLAERSFVEVETPVLTRSTPEGARDYLVPSRVNPGQFYALPQSPQLFKQLLMVGGLDRYYQIVKCFRDEDLRYNRQPEFTQIDIELAFIEREHIYALVDGMLKQLWGDVLGVDVPTPIPQMGYDQAMDEYGSDAPDLRFGLKLVNLSDLVEGSDFQVFAQAVAAGGEVKAIRVPGGGTLSRKDLDDLTEFVRIYGAKGMAWVKQQNDGWQSPIAKFFTDGQKKAIEQRVGLEVGDLVVFCADRADVVADALGNLRKELAKRLDLIDEKEFNFVWITDFPMFEIDPESKRLAAKHHPFTSPVLADLDAHESDPQKIRAQAYDVVLNGMELGGGSIRIHSTEVQQRVFKLLGMDEAESRERFGFLLDALQYGAPPHGGIAFGFDRILMSLVGTQAIRDVIAFPKTQRASDLMTEAPSPVSDAQLAELGIRLRRG